MNQQQLARAAGFAHKSWVSRRESGETDMTLAEFYDLVAAIERIVERRQASMDPAEVLA